MRHEGAAVTEQQSALRVQLRGIRTLRASFASALDQLDDVLVNLRQKAHLAAPWLGDETSDAVAAHYNRRAMIDPDSSYQALERYRDEVLRIHDTLQQMEDSYRRGESDEADRWRPTT